MANNENLGSKKVEQTQENENIVTKILAFFNEAVSPWVSQ